MDGETKTAVNHDDQISVREQFPILKHLFAIVETVHSDDGRDGRILAIAVSAC